MKARMRSSDQKMFLLTIAAMFLFGEALRAEDAPVFEEDRIFSDSSSAVQRVFVGALGGLVLNSRESNGSLGFSFRSGYQFHPEFSLGLRAYGRPDIDTLLRPERPVYLGLEADYYFDRWVRGLRAGVNLGYVSFNNQAKTAAGIRAHYSYPVLGMLALDSELSYTFNSSDTGGNFFALMFGVEFSKSF